MRSGRQTVIMVGTAMEAQGGIATVVRSLVSSGLSDIYVVNYVETHNNGGALVKLLAALKAWIVLSFKLVTSNVEMVHVHVSSGASFWRKCALLVPAFVMRKPILLHLHSGQFHLFYERGSRSMKRFTRYVFESVDGVVVLSGEKKKWVGQEFPRAKVRVIFNPAPDAPASMPERDATTLLFLGKLGDKKGTSDLLRAVGMLVPEFGAVRLMLGGDGDVFAAKALAQRLGIEDSVEFLGWVGGTHKQKLLERAAVFVLPSYSEGLPMGLLEAMAYGMPVVSTPVGGIPEAVTDGVEGFLVEPGDVEALADRLARLLREDVLRREMGAAGARKVASTFAMERIIPQWVALYSELGVRRASDHLGTVR